MFLFVRIRICVLQKSVKRGGEDQFVIFGHAVLGGDLHFPVAAGNLPDVRVPDRRMFQLSIQGFPYVLRSVCPCPQIDLDKGYHGGHVKVFEDISCRHGIKIAITKRCERIDPDIPHVGHLILCYEFIKRESQVRMDFVIMPVFVIPLVFGLQKTSQLFDLGPGPDAMIQPGTSKRVVDPAVCSSEFAVQPVTVRLDSTVLHDLTYGMIAGHTHNGTHFISFAPVGGGVALPSYVVRLFQNRVVVVSFPFQIHSCRKAGRTASHDADFFIPVLFHAFLLSTCSLVFSPGFQIGWDNLSKILLVRHII